MRVKVKGREIEVEEGGRRRKAERGTRNAERGTLNAEGGGGGWMQNVLLATIAEGRSLKLAIVFG